MLKLPGTLIALLAVFVTLAAWPQQRELTPLHLNYLPTVERVVAETQGADAADTAARQAAALGLFRQVIDTLAASDTRTPDEQGLIAYYTKARNDIRQAQGARGDSFAGALAQLDRNAEYRYSVLEHFLPAELANRYLDAIAADGPRVSEAGGRTMALFSAETSNRLTHGAIAALLLLFAFVRERLPFGFNPKDPNKLRAGWLGRAKLSSATGVAERPRNYVYEQDLMPRSYDDPPTGAPPPKIRTETTAFIVRFDDPTISPVHAEVKYFQGMRDGAPMSMVWLQKWWQRKPNVLYLVDDERGVFHFNSGLVRGFVMPFRWPALVYAWLAFTVFMLTPWGEGQGILLAVLAGVAAAGVYWAVLQRLLRRREDDVWEGFAPLRARLEQSAQAKRAAPAA